MSWPEDNDRLEFEQWADLRRHPQADRLRVIVADGSRLVAEALMFTFDTDPRLDAIGYALDGWEAIGLIASDRPDAVVVGANLPGLDQASFTAFAHDFFPHALLILLRERLVPHEVEAAYAAGAADCLPASCSTDELLHAIQQAHNRRIAFERGAREAVMGARECA
jgi:two-component system, OmpR family, response regulator MprA